MLSKNGGISVLSLNMVGIASAALTCCGGTFSDIDLSEIGRHIFMMMMAYGDLKTPTHLVQQET